MSEKKRQLKKREQVLNVLKGRGMQGVTNAELSIVSLRYGAHLGSLYQLGYKIYKESIGEGLYRYTLIKEPSSEYRGKKNAMDVLRNALQENSIDIHVFEGILDNLGISVRYKAGTHNA